MAAEVSRKNLNIFEVRNDDGGVGILIGNTCYLGHDAQDAERALIEAFVGGEDREERAFLTTHEVARMFRIERKTVTRWIKEGKLHPIKVGRSNLFDAGEVDALIDGGAGAWRWIDGGGEQKTNKTTRRG